MKKTQFGATILEGHDIADLPLVSQNAQILENEILKNRAELEDLVANGGNQEDIDRLEKEIKELESKIPTVLDDINVSDSWKVPAGQVVLSLQDYKADRQDVGDKSKLQTENKENLVEAINETNSSNARTSTIVIANYDSHVNSRRGADIVIKEGESASLIIQQAITSLEETGGEIKLMEGKYNIEGSDIGIKASNISITGAGNTVLSGGKIYAQGKNVSISNLQITNVPTYAIWVGGGAEVTISNIKVYDNDSYGILLTRNAVAEIDGICCYDNNNSGLSTSDEAFVNITNSKFYNNKVNGIEASSNSNVSISNVESYENGEAGINIKSSASANISHVRCVDNIKGGIAATSKSAEIIIVNAFLKDNHPNPVYTNDAQLWLGNYESDKDRGHVFVTSCKIIDTKGNTRGVAIRGSNQVFINNQFVGEFKEKINDTSENSTIRDNVGV